MGSATRHALTAATAAITEQLSAIDLAAAQELFSVSAILEDNQQLRALLVDPSVEPEEKAALIDALFGDKVGTGAGAVLRTAAAQRWSNQDEFVAGVEELGIRAAAVAAADSAALESELFAFGGAVASDAQLELALGSKLGLHDAKTELVRHLLAGKALPATEAIVQQLVAHPRGRSVRSGLTRAAAIVADQGGQAVAIVTVAAPVAAAQLTELTEQLSSRYGRKISVNQVIEPAVLGGMRVQIGDEVIDGTIATRLADLRQRLAG